MKKIIWCLCSLLVLSACSMFTKDNLGLGKKAPDEFMVTNRKPLSLPPEYDLRPVVEIENGESKDLSENREFIKKLEADN